MRPCRLTRNRKEADMTARHARLWMALLCSALPLWAMAQSSPAAKSAAPSPETLEPAVDTSKSPPAPASSAPQESQAAATPKAAPPAPAPGATAPPPKGAAAAPGKGAKKGPDRLELEATDVTGNSELPKVLYIVPWKPSELGDMAGRPVHSLLDDVLQPLDRDVFRRENRYYEALTPDAAAAKSDAAQGSDARH
jgi:hypothetical protein